VRRVALDRFSVSLGGGLGPLGGSVFRIGHMGDLNEPMLLGALAGIELALADAGIPHARGGVEAAMDSLRARPASTLQAVSRPEDPRHGRKAHPEKSRG
jgi:alanine-glyoxylate transaminase/serine-glyoxylate transaminase/serine-pyruvate transaminase